MLFRSDVRTGLGAWTATDFWNALHRGRSRDGRRLAPAFPYQHTTLLAREDSDAIFAWLQTRAPVYAPQPPHQMRWPFGTQPALALWQALFFTPATFKPDTRRDAQWNRGAYLVEAVGHCAACHGARNALGALASVSDLGGGSIPGSAWRAPNLLDDRQTGLASTSLDDTVRLLKTGRAAHASALGPMAEVVQQGLQYLGDDDLRALASYLQSRARETPTTPRREAIAAPPAARAGARLYRQHCADCHGESGEGQAGRFPGLRGNRAVLHDAADNVVLAVLHGGYAPVTAGNPAPAGMPPFALELTSAEIAAVVNWIRSDLQGDATIAPRISAHQVEQIRNRSR